MVATFHLHYLGHRIKYGNLEVGNTTQQLLSTTRPCCSIEFIESFLFWVIFATYNIGIYICTYIYKVSYIHSFFLIFNCNIFSALHAKNFEIWKNIFLKLMRRLLYSTIHQVMWYFWVFIVNPFSLSRIIFFLKKTVFPFILLIAKSISLDTYFKLTLRFFLKIISPSWIILLISLDKLNSVDWLLKSWWWILLLLL